MGGKRHKGVGFNRPKKKKVLAVEEVSIEAEESEDEPDLTQGQAPEPEPSPPPSPEPAPPTRDETKQIRSGFAKAHMAKAREQLCEAERKLQVSERRWKKKKQTYHHSGKYSVWDQPSIVKRVEQRLFDADIELGKARALVAFRRDRYIRWRSYYMLTKRMDEDPRAFVADYDMMGFWLRSVRRIAEMPTAPASWRSMWPATFNNIFDWNTEHFGIALTWGLTHTDSLKDGHWTHDPPSTCVDGDAADDGDAAGQEEAQEVRRQTRQAAEDSLKAVRAAAARAFANS